MSDITLTAQNLAMFHENSNQGTRSWSAQEYQALLDSPRTLFVETDAGFALGQYLDHEAQLLMIIVAQEHQKKGEGGNILSLFEDACKSKGCCDVRLEVSESNDLAQRVYTRMHYKPVGLRRHYYQRDDGTRDNALIYLKNL